MHEYGMIPIKWTSSCSDGSGAMIAAYRAQTESNTNGTTMSSTNYIKDVEQYNEIDCRAIYEIVHYLRKNHI